MRKIIVRLLFVIACLVTLGGVVYVIESIRGEHAWRAYKTAAEARGLKLYLADYLPPIPADADNFAAIPLFRDAFTAAENGQTRDSPFALPKGTPPKFSDHAVARPIDLAEWHRFFEGDAEPAKTADDSAASLLGALERYAVANAELHEAAARGRTRFPVRWEAGFSALLPHVPVLRDAARINALRMEAHLAQRNAAAAYQDFRFGLRLAKALEEEPLLICGVVRIAMLQLLGNAVWNGLAIDAWDEESLRRMMADLSEVQPLNDWQFAMNSDRGAMNTVLDGLAAAGGEQRARIFGNALDPGIGEVFCWRLIPAGWLRQNQVWLNKYMDDMLQQIDPARQRYQRVHVRHLPHPSDSFPRRLYYAIAYSVAPAYDRIERNYLAMHTVMQQLRAACALERFRHAHQQYPPALDALVPDFLDAVPRDVIDGQPLRYRLRDDRRFVLYSIARNGKDDGGATPQKASDDRPDWVWQYPVEDRAPTPGVRTP